MNTFMNSLLIGLMVLSAVGTVEGAENRLKNPSFETGQAEWEVAGKAISGRFSTRVRHSGKRAYEVTDKGPSRGQVHTPFFPVRGGDLCYVSMWLRTDEGYGDTAEIDVQFFNAKRRYAGRAKLGGVKSRDWTHLQRFFVVTPKTSVMRVRVQPTDGVYSTRGRVWLDDVVLNVLNDGLGALKGADPQPVRTDPAPAGDRPAELADSAFSEPATVDFEDLAGWTVKTAGTLKVDFFHSQRYPLAGGGIGRLVTRGGTGHAYVELTPPKPIAIPSGADRLRLWVRGGFPEDLDNVRYYRWSRSRPHPRIILVLRDNTGKRHDVKLPGVRERSGRS